METDQYIDMFLDESREHLQAINDNILLMEESPDDFDIVNEIFRSAHTLKGMAGTMGFEDISSLTHKMENVFDRIRNNELNADTNVIDVIFDALEALEEMVGAISEGEDGKKDVSALVHHLELIETGEKEQAATIVEKAPQTELDDNQQMEIDSFQETVIDEAMEQGFSAYQIKVALSENSVLKGARAYMVFEELNDHGEVVKTDPLVEEIEEGEFGQSFTLLFISQSSAQQLEEAASHVMEVENVEVYHFIKKQTNDSIKQEQEISQKLPESERQSDVEQSEEKKTTEKSADENKNKKKTNKTIRMNLERIDELLNLFQEVVINRSRLEVISEDLENKNLSETVEQMNRVTSDMQELILTMRMVQVEQVFNRFPRMIRSLSKDLDKKINLEITGSETEVDRTVIDEIGDPLVHLIRNSVDHGIETPEERIRAGKSEEGTIHLRAYHSGNYVFIEIEDDGAGINREKVQAKAVKNELITSQQAETMTDNQIANLILESGFSTAESVSNISGRGVGLDVVKSTIESLKGKIGIQSKEGEGSIFSIQLPLTLSIITALLVKVQEETYALPLSSITETLLLDEEQIMSAHGREVIDFRGRIVPLISMAEAFDVPMVEKNTEKVYPVVIINKENKEAGLIVDSFIEQKEIVLKSLGNYLGDVFAISGATILGDGHVIMIIDPNALLA